MARLLIVEDNLELANLMLAAAEARGHRGETFSSGRAAIAALGGGGWDAAVVDLLLPDVRGGEVLRALKERGVPAVAISGVYKGERFVKEATEVHGARAFFEKPFDLQALLRTLEAVPGLAPTAPPPPEDDPVLDLEELASEEELLPAPLHRSTPAPLAPAELELRDPLLTDPELLEHAPLDVPASAGAREEVLPLPFAEREKVWGPSGVAAPARPSAPDWSLSGDLARTAVPKLLNAYYQARHSGELKLRQGQVQKVVLFAEGRPVYAASNLLNERFARFCVRRGVLPEAEVARVAALAHGEKLRTGEAMVRLGLLAPERREDLLREQVKEIIWSTFAWAEGSYGFSPGAGTREDAVRVSVFPGDLILEGVLRTEPLVRLRQVMGAGRRLFPTADPPYELHEFQLTGPQARLLAYADGSKTVEDLVALTDLSEREALGALRAFELLGLLEERREEPSRRRISFGL